MIVRSVWYVDLVSNVAFRNRVTDFGVYSLVANRRVRMFHLVIV